jgi:hypothetical protein
VKASVRTSQADGLAIRMAAHFDHKVPVSTEAGVTRVETRFGRVELEPGGAVLEVRLDPVDREALPRLREVVETHLQRFARGESLAFEWR